MKADRNRRMAIGGTIGIAVLLLVTICSRPWRPPDAESTPPARHPLGGSPTGQAATGDAESTDGVVRDAEPGIPADREPDPRTARLVDLEIRTQDGPTGRPIAVPAIHLLRDDGQSLLLRSDGSVHRATGVRLEDSRGRLKLGLRVTPPPGLASESAVVSFEEMASAAAEVVVATIVLWPTIDVRAELVDRDGRSVSGALLWVGWPVTLHSILLRSAKTDDSGWARLRGVPLVSDERLIVARSGFFDVLVSVPLEPRGARSEETVRLVLPVASQDEPVDDEEAEDEVRVFVSAFREAVFERMSEPPPSAQVPTGTRLVVTARRDDGSPVRHAFVTVAGRARDGSRDPAWQANGRTDTLGRVEFTDLPVGLAGVTLGEHDLPRHAVSAELVPGGTVHVELVAPRGRTVTVHVLDSEARPVPSVRVVVGAPVMDGATQRIGIRTDGSGRAVLTGLPTTSVSIQTRLGTRSASGTVPPEVDEIRLVLRREAERDDTDHGDPSGE